MANKTKQIVLSDAAETVAVGNRPVFIDTSLGTRLGINLSLSDTVSDFKRKIEKEHTLNFSNIGDIVVHALKVKRRGQFYRLSDSLLVKEAFDFVTKNWFLSVDASIVEKNRDERLENTHNVDGVDLLIHDDDSSRKRLEFEIEILEKPGDSVEEASRKRKSETEQKVQDGDLREPAVISQSVLGDGERRGNDMDSSDTRKSKKRKTSVCKNDQVSDGAGKKKTSESGEISVKQKNSNTDREVEDQELLDVDTRQKADETGEKKEFAPEDKMETSEDYIPVDVESNQPLAIKKPEDLNNDVGVSGNKNIGTSSQAERPDEPLKKNDSDRKQSNDLDSTFSVETEINKKALNVSVGQKSKSVRIKSKGLDDNVVAKSSGPDFQGTKVSAEPLGDNCDKQSDENATNDKSDLSPKSGNEVKSVETKEKEPVKRRLKKKQTSEKNLSDVLGKKDAVPQNPTPPAVTSNKVVASSKTKGKMGKLESANIGAQSVKVAEEPKSADNESHAEANKTCDIRQGSGETEPKTSALNKMEASKNLQTDILEQGAVSKNDDDSLKVQSINEVKAKDVDTSTVNLVGENTSSVVLPTDVGKKRKTSKKTNGLGENLPLGAKPDLVVKEVPVKKISRKRQKNLPDVQVGPESEKTDKVQNAFVFAEPKSVTKQIEVSGTGNKITLAKPLPNKITSSNEVLLSKKKVPKAKTDSVQTSSNVRSSTKPKGKEKIIGNSSTVLVQEEKSGESTVHPEKKPTKASGNKSANLNSVSKETQKPNAVNQSDVKAPIKSLEPKKRLVSTPGSIFKDNSDDDDDDEGSDDSNASTRTPSDYSSDYSDGEESNANSKSLEKGTKSADKRSILKSCASGGKGITFDTIIRSSRRYKKAIVTGSELQVDFVPDSQPIP